jgi:hypothetical protein
LQEHEAQAREAARKGAEREVELEASIVRLQRELSAEREAREANVCALQGQLQEGEERVAGVEEALARLHGALQLVGQAESAAAAEARRDAEAAGRELAEVKARHVTELSEINARVRRVVQVKEAERLRLAELLQESTARERAMEKTLNAQAQQAKELAELL